jgi:hypothetical protein
MTGTEWIQRALIGSSHRGDREDTIHAIITTADALEKANVAPWDVAQAPRDNAQATPLEALVAHLDTPAVRRAVSAEREECARIVDDLVAHQQRYSWGTAPLEEAARLIRKRSDP